jgi:hypothetical protein
MEKSKELAWGFLRTEVNCLSKLTAHDQHAGVTHQGKEMDQ